ncbi:prolipoprotein diacylglyceryl transferase [Methylomarinum sp. Ch1-1]|uniref:Phosphatidylglycerol--prolipoprotein diacylglyceryl transferase n=1 Tax=Methylomarinum roseum TaxID=3067653 RepID=A0AAU7NRN3_9GAMM|nr:prolipoprotein diacylglyceryl transferase [Methylomarinum sp. Ch1-1]MDP4520383.1 prolipoprotein diacylglyceryl transferase [Methylomarinum sp. Ch1-1]
MMNYFVWDIDPILLALGPLKIRWYGLMFASAFMTSYGFMYWIYKREQKNVEDLDRMLWYLAIGTVVGARLGHCLFYDPAYYFSHPLKILAIWEGGLASHGAFIGILISLYLYKLKTDDSYIWLMDRVAVSCILGASLIRIGNFFNSEILGIPTDVPWAVIFSRIDYLPRHPVQLYESAGYALVFLVLIFAYKKTAYLPIKGLLTGLFTTLVFLLRFLLEFVKTEQAAYANELSLTTGQFLSIPFFLIGVAFIIWSLRNYRTNNLSSG